MVNLKNYNVGIKYFVLFLTFILSVSCGQQKYYVTKIEGKEIGITDQNKEVAAIEDFIKPYRENIDKDLSTILAYAPQTIDKSGEWQTPMGNLFADVALKEGNPIFTSRENKTIDFVLLNHGGVRSIIPKGNVTARTAFEIMPFENSMVVIALKGEQVI
jgi:2',3'-cyclic-nucleotide 2'-phosphodiesterase (5'-nucleotidase family)